MTWQDTVIALCQFGFIVAFIPTIRGKDKPAIITSFMNSVLVCIITFCLATLGLWLSVVTAGVLAVLWLVVALQKISLDKVAKE